MAQKQWNKTPERWSEMTPSAVIFTLRRRLAAELLKRPHFRGSNIQSLNRRQTGAISGVMFDYISAY